jgi:WD40 repeat protein
MDYVAGPTLAQFIGGKPLPAKRAVSYVKTIAEAIHYAHERGVLHRDLKPSNVLIDAFDQPRITDFGLAKRLTPSSDSGGTTQDLTLTGQVLGSPGYMAPEQAAGSHALVGRPTDVYALGAMLYHVLTARPPFTSEALADTLHQVRFVEPVSPRLLNASVPRDLETVCLKCLDKEPRRRYATAAEFADDLGRVLRDEPIHARRVSRTEKSWRWCRRKPALAGLVVGLHLTLALGLTGVLWQWRRAVAGELSAREHQYASDMNLVHQVWQEGDSQRAKALLRAHIPKPGQSDVRGFEWRYLWKLCQQDDSQSISTNFERGVAGLACSSDGKSLAVASGQTLKVLEVASLREIFELKAAAPNSSFQSVAWSPVTPNLLATADTEGMLNLIDATTKAVTILGKNPAREAIQCLRFSPDGKKLAVAMGPDVTESLQLWDLQTKTKKWAVKDLSKAGSVVFTPDSQALVSGGGESGNAILWDALSGNELARFPPRHTSGLQCIALSANGTTLATASADNRVILWEFSERRARRTLESPAVGVVAFSGDGRLIASGGDDGLIRVWDVGSGERQALFRGHSGFISGLAFTPDSSKLISGGADRTIRTWELKSSPDPNVLFRQARMVNVMSFSPDARILASASYYRDWVELWDVPSRKWLTNLTGHLRDAWCAAFSPDGKMLATASSDTTVRLWRSGTFELIGVLTNPFSAGPIAFSPDSKVMAVACFTYLPPDGRERLWFWDVPAMQRINPLPGASVNASTVAFSNDGRLLAVGNWDGSVRIWNFHSARKLQDFSVGTRDVRSMTFSPDETRLAFVSGDKMFVYDVASGRRLGALTAHMGDGWAVAFAPDGKTLASAGNDGTVKFWHLPTLELALNLKQEIGPVFSLAFTKDGSLLASGGSDGDVHLWPAPSQIAQTVATRREIDQEVRHVIEALSH